MKAMKALPAWWVVALVACGKHPKFDHALFDELPIETPPGVSDLTIDDRGILWAIPERDREVDEIALPLGTVVHHPLDGVPDGVDTESLAWLGNGKFVIGTEGQRDKSASIAFAELRAGRLVVTRTRALTSAELGVELEPNKGVEGICGHGGPGAVVLAAIETVGTFPDGTRWAPLAWIRGEAITVTKLRLTTTTGKISGLDCHFAADGSADVLAIERHYGVCRLLRFHVAPGAVEVTPTIDLDLGVVLHGALNLEGIARLPDGRVVLVNDNQGADLEGPTELLVFHPR